ncbi:hypothetical protein [Streptomyces stelliscabiei]|uniref:Uncharacterized protein n=1 Tax=Streptomyces stelliscabiei TaxID=146820 RepID=A0A8I0P0B8_9ACTN|nr:hypothetical protein [Streptomyces stelliscabiei]KND45377.1 hypothetical protein IQ64_07390 [Streptomyces stelliscabiei]MBE1597206.1 hypothetical protein [Streptomyces stelliscabiei]
MAGGPGGPAPYRKNNRAERAELAELVFDLKLRGLSFRAIEEATQDPNGPTGGKRVPAGTARDLVRDEAARRVDPKVDAWRAIVVERLEAAHARLDRMEAAAHKVLERHHITVNNGRIITLDDGEPLLDDGPVLAAIDRLAKIEDARLKNNESLRRLFGLDMPVKVDATVTEVTQQDLELQEMLREAKAHVAAQEEELREGAGGEA